MNLAQTLKTLPCFSKLYEKIKDNAKLCERMSSLSTAVQVIQTIYLFMKKDIHYEYLFDHS